MKPRDFIPASILPVLRALRWPAERHDLYWELRRRLASEPALPGARVARVLVICHGNICRSPFAAVRLASARRDLEIRSGGLEAREGSPAEPGAIRVAREFGVDLTRHRAHRLEARDLDWADLVLGMTGRHLESVRARWPGAAPKARLLGDFLPEAPFRLEDPWGCADDEFRAVFARIERATMRLAERLGGPGDEDAERRQGRGS